ncbi:unnamed protein product [Dovyalis caffra]|uniref:DNA-directed RNA polymerase I subunit rpa49 n=1 Tax=Dovyalis caffra TaxID=77055 RepID=A0AAV1SWA5_9ROSI|nr:unnamed protein product [Dovyalis caffra]
MGMDLDSSHLSISESPQTAAKKSKKKRKRQKERDNIAAAAHVQNGQQPISDETSQSRIDVRLEVVNNQVDKTAPIVGYFPSGYNPHKRNDINDAQEPNLPLAVPPSVKLYRNAQRANVENSSGEKNEKGRSSDRLELVVSPKGSKVEFVGNSYKGEAMAAQLCTYALGVFDKATQTLKIMPVAGNKILRMEPKVQGWLAADTEPANFENGEITAEERAAKIRQLNVQYGPKKSIIRDKKMQALRKGDDPLSQKDLGRKIENVPVNKGALENTSGHSARNIPPYNSSANTPQEAYPLDGIILTGEWDFLEDIYQILQIGGELANNDYPTFVCKRIQKLHEIQDEVEKKRLSCIFSYINHLIKFKDQHSMDGASSARSHKFPSILRQKFFDMFNPETRRLSVENIDLLVSYVLVLTLYADDFRTFPADISNDLRMNPATVKSHYRNLGCKMEREKNKYFATLPVPLDFPQPKRKFRKR